MNAQRAPSRERRSRSFQSAPLRDSCISRSCNGVQRRRRADTATARASASRGSRIPTAESAAQGRLQGGAYPSRLGIRGERAQIRRSPRVWQDTPQAQQERKLHAQPQRPQRPELEDLAVGPVYPIPGSTGSRPAAGREAEPTRPGSGRAGAEGRRAACNRAASGVRSPRGGRSAPSERPVDAPFAELPTVPPGLLRSGSGDLFSTRFAPSAKDFLFEMSLSQWMHFSGLMLWDFSTPCPG